MKRYTFKIVIMEGCDEFWEDLEKRGVTGCDEVKELIKEGLWSVGFDAGPDSDCELTLEKYENADV